MKKIAPLFSLTAVCLAMVGCGAMQDRKEVQQSVGTGFQDLKVATQNMREVDEQNSKRVQSRPGVWLGNKAVKVSREVTLPPVFSKNVQFQFSDTPDITVVAERLRKIIGIPVRVTPDAQEPYAEFAQRVYQSQSGGGGGMQFMQRQTAGFNTGAPMPQPMPMPGASGGPLPNDGYLIDKSSPYMGTVYNLLDQIASRYGVGWDYMNGELEFSRLVTRHYQIAAIPDKNTTTTSFGKSGSLGGGGTGVSNSTQAADDEAQSSATTSIEDAINVIESYKSAISIMITPGVGKLTITDTGNAIVHDTREVQQQVRKIIEAENAGFSRQIRLRVTFLDMRTTTANDLGVSWSYIVDAATRKYTNNFLSPAGTPGGLPNFGQFGFKRETPNSSTEFFIRALSELGNVSIVKDETYLLMNNRTTSIADVDNFTYAARQTSSVTNALTGESTVGVEPGVVTTGTFYNLRSTILQNGSVITRLGLDTSMRGKMETFESNGAPIQFPSTNGNKYNLYSTVRSGLTSVVAAIDNTQLDGTDRSFDASVSPLLGGGVATNKLRRATLILLTPEIVEGAI